MMSLAPDSRYVSIAGAPVHVAEYGGVGRPIVAVHGLGGSHVNWHQLAPHLTDHGEVTAIDLPGFGLTPPAGRRCTVESNQVVLDAYLKTFPEPVVLLGNSMGGAISILQAASSPESVSHLVLISPAQPKALGPNPDPVVVGAFAAYMVPLFAHRLLALRRRYSTPEELAIFTLRLCSAHYGRLAPDTVARHVELARKRSGFPGLDTAFVRAARSVVAFGARRADFDRLIASIAAPTLVLQGEKDRLVNYRASERLAGIRPDWQVDILEDVGHIAMLEVPVEVGRAIVEFLK